jgi:hypothetical protein
MKKLLTIIGAVTLIAITLIVGTAALPTGAADHLDAPGIVDNPMTDINDVYVFQSPSNPDNTVLIMTVNPLAGSVNAPIFDRKAVYDFVIHNDGSASPNKYYKVTFGPADENGVQEVKLTDRGSTVAKGVTGQDIPVDGGGTLHAGLFDDPFFFDLLAFRDNLNFCANPSNFFAGLNVNAIVLELPSAALGSNNVGVWAQAGRGTKLDRMGRPAINTVFIPSDQKNAFNQARPQNDVERFTDEVVATLLALGNDQATAEALAAFLLPDILTVDTSSSTGFPNGRRLADDVIDIELGLITGGGVTTDCVDNDSNFSDTFPYLAPAN